MNQKCIHDLLADQARKQPDKTALWWQGRATPYGQLQARVEKLAGQLAGCGSQGDSVGILAWNCPEFIELIYACALAGRVLVPLNARLAPSEHVYQLQTAGVSTLFGDSSLLAPLRDHPDIPSPIDVIEFGEAYFNWLQSGPGGALPRAHPEDAAWILFTSGSTGRPKGAVLSHRSFLAGLESAALGRPVEPRDIYLYPFPLFHVAAHNVLLQHQYGAEVALLRSFDAGEVLKLCRKLQVTTLSLAPTMIAMLLDHPGFDPDDLSSVRTIGYGASAMPVKLLQKLLTSTSVGLCQSYGMTELAGSVSFLTVEDHERAARGQAELLQSVGKPLATARLKLEDGEILVQAAQCMQGYWRDAGATAQALQDGWLRTGDMGRFDEAGYLYIIDRKKDMIISGGENVASREVEEVLRQHPSVKDCAVIGITDPRWGESVCAVLVEAGPVGDEELDRHCRQHLAGFKTPKTWMRLAELPLNAAGKVDKPGLRVLACETPPGESTGDTGP